MRNTCDTRLLENLRHNCGVLMRNALDNPEVIEIMLNPDGRLWIERFGCDQECVGTIDVPQGKLILSLVASAQEMVVSDKTPVVDHGEFPLEGSRFAGVYPPIVGPGASFCIRKKASKVFTLEDYLTQGVLSQKAIHFIEEAVISYKNIVVVGGTSSGKTTFVNAIIQRVATLCPVDRLIILQDTPELQCSSENVVFLYSRETSGNEYDPSNVSMRRLAKICMRYAPKRILVGEVRDAAALELLKLWNTGHPGGIGTFHADSAAEALPRLEELVEEAGLGAKHKLIGRAIDLVLYMTKNKENKRILSKIIKVHTFNTQTENYETEDLYDFS